MPKVAIESRKQAAKRPRPPLPNRTVGIYKNVVGTKKFRLQCINVGQLFFNQKKRPRKSEILQFFHCCLKKRQEIPEGIFIGFNSPRKKKKSCAKISQNRNTFSQYVECSIIKKFVKNLKVAKGVGKTLLNVEKLHNK